MRYRTRSWDRLNIRSAGGPHLPFPAPMGFCNFTDAGYVSSHMLNAQAGYDYLLDPKDSIAVLASYGKIDYTGASTTFHDGLHGGAGVRKENHGTHGISGGSRAAADSFDERQPEIFSSGIASVNSALPMSGAGAGFRFRYMRGLSCRFGRVFGSHEQYFFRVGAPPVHAVLDGSRSTAAMR